MLGDTNKKIITQFQKKNGPGKQSVSVSACTRKKRDEQAARKKWLPQRQNIRRSDRPTAIVISSPPAYAPQLIESSTRCVCPSPRPATKKRKKNSNKKE